MNNLKYCILIVAVLIAAAIGLTNCIGHGGKLTSITINQTHPVISDATTSIIPLTFQATATLSDGSTLIWQLVTWSLQDPTIASISNAAGSNGLVTPTTVITTATTTVTATDQVHPSISATAQLTVVHGSLTSITVSPTNPPAVISLGTTTKQFQALATYGTTTDTTQSVSWSSSDPGVATISNTPPTNGLATLVSQGQTTITATDLYTSPSISGISVINVGP